MSIIFRSLGLGQTVFKCSDMTTGYAGNHVPSDLKIFEPKKDEVAGEWRKRHYEELYDPYCSPNFMRVIKSSKVRSAGMWHEWRTGVVRTGFWREDMWKRYHLEDLGVDGKIILKWIFKAVERGCGLYC